MAKIIKPQPLTANAFAVFGDVIEIGDNPMPINYGQTERHHDLAHIDVNKKKGRPLVNIFRTAPMDVPITIKILERHPHSSQAFIPLSNQPYLVVVAPKGNLDEKKIQAFIASARQGVNYHAGVWHHYSLALNATSDFLVIDRGAKDDNCDEVKLTTPLILGL